MKIKVVASELQKKMQRALGVISAKPAYPALAYAKIEVSAKGKGLISGTDLGMSMIQTVDIALEADQAGFILIPAKTIAAFLTSLPSSASVTIETEGDATKNEMANVVILAKSGKSKAKMGGITAKDFPAIEQMPPTQFSLNNEAMKVLIGRTEFAAPSKGGRSAVPAVLLESTATNLRAVATDGYRVAVADQPGAGAGEFTVNLPKILLPLLKELPGTVISFAQSETNYFFQGDGEQLLIRKSPTVFPPYQRAFVQTYVTDVTIPVPTLQTLISGVEPFMDKDNQAFNLTVDGSEMTLRSSSIIGEGESSETVTVGEKSVSNKLRMNPKFVLEFLSQVEGKVLFQLSSEKTLAKFTNEKGDYQYFIMPMQQPAAAAPKA